MFPIIHGPLTIGIDLFFIGRPERAYAKVLTTTAIWISEAASTGCVSRRTCVFDFHRTTGGITRRPFPSWVAAGSVKQYRLILFVYKRRKESSHQSARISRDQHF